MGTALLYPLQLTKRFFVRDVAGVESGGWFEEKNPAFLVSYRLVFNSTPHHHVLPFFDPFVTIAKLHAKTALHHKKHFVFVFVMVKHELALELVELNVLSIELGTDVGL